MGKKSYLGGDVRQWPYLVILFSTVHQILSDHHHTHVVDTVITRAETSALSPSERMLWLDLLTKLDFLSKEVGSFLLDDNVHCTTFGGTSPNHLHFIHSEPTSFLCLKVDGSLIHLPDLKVPYA
jgi:hypothetical protein